MALREDWEALGVTQECSVREQKASHGLGVPARLESLLWKLARNLKGCQDVHVSAVSDAECESVVYVPSSSTFARASRKYFLEEESRNKSETRQDPKQCLEECEVSR